MLPLAWALRALPLASRPLDENGVATAVGVSVAATNRPDCGAYRRRFAALVIGLIAASASLVGSAPAWAAPSALDYEAWHASRLPLPAGADENTTAYRQAGLESIDCGAELACVAVGSYADEASGNQLGLGEELAAGVWSATKLPLPADASARQQVWLPSVSCPEADRCIAGGTYNTGTGYVHGVLETLSAGVWHAVSAPLPPDALAPPAGHPESVLRSVACSSPTICFAVGYYYAARESVPVRKPLIDVLEGGVWSAFSPGLPPASEGDADLVSVTCPAASMCIAVGGDTNLAEGLIATWNSGSWSTTQAPAPGAAHAKPVLSHVDCGSSTDCIAISEPVVEGPAVIERLRGTDWTATTAAVPVGASPTDASFLFGAGCVPSGPCVAAGDYDDGGRQHSMLESETEAGDWSAAAPVFEPEGQNEQTCLFHKDCTSGGAGFGITCGAPTICVAAGAAETTAFDTVAAIDTWRAEWLGATVLPLPEETREPLAGMSDVACVGSLWCEAVGGYNNNRALFHPLAEEARLTVSLTVLPPSSQPPLTVTIGTGGGGGVAGAPDPSSFENGNCDPGADTDWLHVVGVTFTCIVSDDVWSDPTLISAKKRCVISLGIDFLPFVKALKLPKYIKEADSVEAALKLLSRRLAAASYPGKGSGDAAAVDDVQTSLKAISTPDQALLTVVSSRRVLEGLSNKLGSGGAAAAKLAHDVSIVRVAVTNLVETVSGIEDIKDCVTAFNGP
jgi:hypothetical protein